MKQIKPPALPRYDRKMKEEAYIEQVMSIGRAYTGRVEAHAVRTGLVVAESDDGAPCTRCGKFVQALWPEDKELLCGYCIPTNVAARLRALGLVP